MNIKQIDPNIKKEIIKYRDKLESKGINVTKIILFGSFVKGKNDEHSDIDVAVVSPEFGKDYQKEMVKLLILSHKINNLIEPHPFNERELKNKYNALSNEIRKYGLLVK